MKLHGHLILGILGCCLGLISPSQSFCTPTPKKPSLSVNKKGASVHLHATYQEPQTITYQGWDYLVSRLREAGVTEAQIRTVYGDKRMPSFTFIPFAIAPRESTALYRPHYSAAQIKLGREFLTAHWRALQAAEQHFGVTRYVVAAILLVETKYGRVLGKNLIIHRLSRIASVKEPRNLSFNYRRLKRIDPAVTWESVTNRASHLEATFLPEIVALFEIFEREKIHPFSLVGSYAGAFGIPQFLPSSFLRFAFDGNKDGRTSLFDPEDAIWSTAHFLHGFGWIDDAPIEVHRAAVWKYNHSDAYVDMVLKLAETLEQKSS